MHIKCITHVLFALLFYSMANTTIAIDGPGGLLFVPLSPTPIGIQTFFTNVFNSPLYAKEVFPNSTIHLEQLLGIGRKEQLPLEYATTVLWLFYIKALDSRYINADSLDQFVVTVAQTLDYHVQTDNQKQAAKDIIKTTILESFAHNSQQIVENPQLFFDTISDQIVTKVSFWIDQQQAFAHLQNTLTILLTTMAQKAMWDLSNPLLWQQIKNIANNLATLEQSHLINKQQLNTLYWALVVRFCYLVELQANAISLDVCKEILEDITASSQPLLHLPDLEPNITTKAERLRQTFIDNGCLARAQAREYGIIA